MVTAERPAWQAEATAGSAHGLSIEVGRERYQILLIEYLLDCQQDGTNVLPLDATLDGRPYEAGGYAAFVLQQLAAKNGGAQA